MREYAPAKINLFLHVGDKRPDGYHAVQSLVVFADVADVLSFAPAAALSLAIDGPFAPALAGGGDNLVLKAAAALAAQAKIAAGAAIALTKNLPVASGIGGGSADAAAALRGLSRLWNLALGEADLSAIAETLGSDVPACLANAPVWMEGRGERLTLVPALPEMALLLVNPGVAIATADVFRALDARRGTAMTLPPDGFRDTADVLRFLEGTANDLEAPARTLQPVIGDVLEALKALPGALFARMSGSGATCFAIFADEHSASSAEQTLRARRAGWWIAATRIAATGSGPAPEIVGVDIGPSDDGL
jgi:4-diphosphocytidyl-2-C-methyl-D-erythritol kinase